MYTAPWYSILIYSSRAALGMVLFATSIQGSLRFSFLHKQIPKETVRTHISKERMASQAEMIQAMAAEQVSNSILKSALAEEKKLDEQIKKMGEMDEDDFEIIRQRRRSVS